MGLMDRIRDMFTEEVEVPAEQPIKKEVIQVSIPGPSIKKEEEVPPVVEEVVKEERSSSPIFFDDNDFANLEPPKRSTRKPFTQVEKPKKKEEVKVEKKIFKPTPIISPVYGVLDKNYHKEDIRTKNNSFNSTYYNHKDVSIDDIRKKAYGTLEDELEITLFGKKDDYAEESSLDIDMFDELMESSEEKLGNTEKIDSSDLFNMIDSMYENEDDNNGIC